MLKKRGEVLVYISGSWDLFHVGHLRALKRAKAYGDKLLVGVSTDRLMESYKGVKPIIPFAERMEIIASLAAVDHVVEQRKLMDIRTLEKYGVDVAAIGDDWKGKYLEGLEWMKKRGRVVYLPYTRHTSTTLIKKKIITNSYELIRAELHRELEIDLPRPRPRSS